MVLPLTGSVAVSSGLDTFTWTGAPLTPFNCVPGAAIIVDGLGYFIKERIDTSHGRFTRVYAEANHGGRPAEIEQISPDQVATATLNRRASDLFSELELIQPNFDRQVDDIAGRAQYDDEWMSEHGRPFAVLVSNAGNGAAAIFSKASPATADWSDPAPYSGPKGDRGWAPQLSVESDGERGVFKLIGYAGGEGTPPTANVGKYLKEDGTFTSVIGDAKDMRGRPGDITGVMPFWQARITADTSLAQAREGLTPGERGVFTPPDFASTDLTPSDVAVLLGDKAGFYQFASPNGQAMILPPDFPQTQGVIIGFADPYSSGGTSWQVLTGYSGNRMWRRASTGASTWSAWAELWHTGNLTRPSAPEIAAGTATILRGWAPADVAAAIAARPSGAVNPQCRLTLTPQVAVMQTDVAAAGSVYLTPVGGNKLPIFDGTSFVPQQFSEISQLLSDATKSPAAAPANHNHDLFAWLDGATLRCTRGWAWTGDRGSSGLEWIDGIPVNAADILRGPAARRGLYVGTIRTNAAGLVDWVFGGKSDGGKAASFGLWNAFNRVPIRTSVINGSDNWAYGTDAWRAAQGSANMRVSAVRGLDLDPVAAEYVTLFAASEGGSARVGIGVNSTSAFSGSIGLANIAGVITQLAGKFSGLAGEGWRYLSALEWAYLSGTFYGDAANPATTQSSVLEVELWQ